eukprot:COSAG01_NODE_1531_length_10004_cov_5.769006_6_plen_117_part_00
MLACGKSSFGSAVCGASAVRTLRCVRGSSLQRVVPRGPAWRWQPPRLRLGAGAVAVAAGVPRGTAVARTRASWLADRWLVSAASAVGWLAAAMHVHSKCAMCACAWAAICYGCDGR